MKSDFGWLLPLAILAFGVSAWLEYDHDRIDRLEPRLPGFPGLTVNRRYNRGSASPREPRRSVEPGAQNGGSEVSEINAALTERDFSQVEALLARLAARDPLAALDIIHRLPVWAQFRATEVVLSEWLKLAPETAWNYSAAHNLEFFTSQEFVDAITASGRFDLGAQAINRLQTVDDRRTAARNLFQAWAANDLTGFTAWGKTLPSEIAGLAYAEIAARYFAEGPIDQAKLNSLLGQSPNDINNGWSTFAQRLISEAGYARAKDVFNHVSQPAGPGGAYAILAYNAPSSDALEWLDKISNLESRQSAEVMVVNRLANSGEPEMAAQIALTSTNQAVLDSQLARILPMWATKDPVAAMNFLQATTKLSPTVKTNLITVLTSLLPNRE